MCACSFDMLFTFVYTGWEGTANDARVLMDAISNEENKFPMPREGRYYVVDSAYTNMPGFLTPYRGERNDELFSQFMAEDLLVADEESSSTGQESTSIDIDVSAANIELMNNVRDDIAGTMWIYHQRRHHHQHL
ncbi:uncharacterized protein LOC113313049 [Papaver somniferum]|uniref:uncharacterized protein LOC113313049 n=1 Tax=Papaver somniferum TaxID=3469 RepID=UPI000E7009BE|nr:uncharacterized protein LOC113313049 [Papaver somniferum]